MLGQVESYVENEIHECFQLIDSYFLACFQCNHLAERFLE